MRRFRSLIVAENAHPLVKQLFEIIHRERMGLFDLAERSGVNRNTIQNWRKHFTPSIATFIAVLNVLGYELKIVKKKDPDE